MKIAKTCTKCQVLKSLAEFNKGPCADGLSAWCRACRSADYRASLARDPEYSRRQHLRIKYCMTLEEYNAKLEAQGGVCALCKSPPKVMPLHVDHDHSCCPGKKTCGNCIRGLVCWNCNVFLGKLEGRVGVAALEYLQLWGGDDDGQYY